MATAGVLSASQRRRLRTPLRADRAVPKIDGQSALLQKQRAASQLLGNNPLTE